MQKALAICVFLCAAAAALADGPADNNPDTVRRIPKLGIEVPEDQRKRLEAELDLFSSTLERLKRLADAGRRQLLPDVEIYYKAASWALKYQEFFDPKEIDVAFALIKEGMTRAEQLEKHDPQWTEQTGLVVRGYVSKIDGSVQPYGLVIPKSYSDKGPRVRCDIWFHGRGETLSELNFINGRQKQVGEYAPADTIVLHPYGRYCNAAKFAGEIDALEALEAVQKHYRIDEDRISVRGFSMGGASAWQFATHYTDRWFAANPGAGFSETPEFLRVFQKEELKPTWWEKKLWQWYDCTDWAANLYNLPTIAYSGEEDSQKQAADIMAKALEKEGITLTHIIAPKTKHSIHKDSKVEIEKGMASLAKLGRVQNAKSQCVLTTSTLRYNKMNWITINGIKEHWIAARVAGGMDEASRLVSVRCRHVTDFTFNFSAGQFHVPLGTHEVTVMVVSDDFDGDDEHVMAFKTPPPRSDRSWRMELHREEGKWKLGPRPAEPNITRKTHGLQGPIDDAFMDSFIFVRPTGKARSELMEKWSKAELDRAIEHWRRHFRGDARVKDDKDITDADIASANLILWGDPASNSVMGKVIGNLPIPWNEKSIILRAPNSDEPRGVFTNDHHALVLIAPNPLNRKRYVVLNSSFTFREYAYLNNARQVPMLPDWAVVDLRTPPGTVWPGKIVDAGFFDETWRLKPQQ